MKTRTQRGIHSIELVGGLMVLVPIVLYGIDYATVLYGGQMNASCCSAACRSAAQGPPTGYAAAATNTPKGRASTTLARMAQPGAVIRVKKTVRVKEIVNTPIPQDPYGGPFLGNVTIKTRCDVFPPFLLPFVSKQVTLYTSQTYPWTYVMAASYQSSGSGGGGGSMGGTTIGTGGQSLNFMRTFSPMATTGTGGGGGTGSGAPNDISLPIPDNAP